MKEQKGFAGFKPGHRLTPVLEQKLSEADPDYKNDPSIKWNFTKFLVDRKGNVIERFEPTTDVSEIEERIKDLLLKHIAEAILFIERQVVEKSYD